MLMKRLLKFVQSMIIFGLLSSQAGGAQYYTKQWTSSILLGSLPHSTKLKYYLEPQLRLINDDYVFNQAFFLTGLGYSFSPDLLFLLGPGWVVTKTPTGETYHEYRLWQQLNWQIVNHAYFTLSSRTRMEEKERSNQSQVAIQLRQRLWARIPIKNTNQYYYSLFDEVFFNLNHPSWTSPHFFEQNRAFLGIGKQITKETMMDVGYLNQQQFGPPHIISHVIFLSFTIVL